MNVDLLDWRDDDQWATCRVCGAWLTEDENRVCDGCRRDPHDDAGDGPAEGGTP